MLCDCECPTCKTVYEDKVLFNDEKVICKKCNVECVIVPSFSGHFRLKYDNKKDKVSWGNEGYATSQYHSAQKKLCKNNIFVQGGKEEKGVKQ